MGKRFLADRYPYYPEGRRQGQAINEHEEHHHLRPYGLSSGTFAYRNRFQKKNQSRTTNQAVKRAEKKKERRQARKDLEA